VARFNIGTLLRSGSPAQCDNAGPSLVAGSSCSPFSKAKKWCADPHHKGGMALQQGSPASPYRPPWWNTPFGLLGGSMNSRTHRSGAGSAIKKGSTSIVVKF